MSSYSHGARCWPLPLHHLFLYEWTDSTDSFLWNRALERSSPRADFQETGTDPCGKLDQLQAKDPQLQIEVDVEAYRRNLREPSVSRCPHGSLEA